MKVITGTNMTIKNWLTENHLSQKMYKDIYDKCYESGYYEISESNLIKLIQFIVDEQKKLCANEYIKYLNRQSETDVVTNILYAKEVKYED